MVTPEVDLLHQVAQRDQDALMSLYGRYGNTTVDWDPANNLDVTIIEFVGAQPAWYDGQELRKRLRMGMQKLRTLWEETVGKPQPT